MSVLAIDGSVMMLEQGFALADFGGGFDCCCEEPPPPPPQDCPAICSTCPDVLTCSFFNPVLVRGGGVLWRFIEVTSIVEKVGGPSSCFWDRTSTPVNNVHVITSSQNQDPCVFIEPDEPAYPAWQLSCYSPPSGAPDVWQLHIRVVRPDGLQLNINFAKTVNTDCPEGKYFICDLPEHQDCSSHGGTIHVPACETETPFALVTV